MRNSKAPAVDSGIDAESGNTQSQAASHRQLMQYDSQLGYKFLPGLKMRVAHEGGGYLVKTNQEGFRCNNEVTARKTKLNRVLVFGDSYTAGDGVSNGKRYSDILERNLNETEVLNFGLSGTGTDQQFIIFREYAKKVDHDAVVISVLVENIQRNVLHERVWADDEGQPLLVPKPWFELSTEEGVALMGVPVPHPYKVKTEGKRENVGAVGRFVAIRKLVNLLGPNFKDVMQKLTRYQPLPEYNSADSYGWKLMQAILEKWISESRTPTTVVVIPVYQYVEKTANYANIRKRFDEFSKASGASVYHVIDDLWTYPADVRRSFRFRADCHLTPDAHKVIGESIARVLAPALRKS
jgi:lysophospholipase L1-like esterase